MNKLKIGFRLNLAFGTMLLMLMVIAFIGWSSLSATKTRMDIVVSENNVKMALSNRMLTDVSLVARSVRSYIIYKDKDLQATLRGRINDASKNLIADVERLGGMVRSEKAKQLHAEIKTKVPDILRLSNQVLELASADKLDEATIFLQNTVQKQQDGTFSVLNEMIQLLEKQNQELIEKMHAEYNFAVNFLLLSTLFACMAAAALAWSITRSITRPINEAVSIAQTVAAGDLTRHIEVQGKDEVSQLLEALKAMTTSLATIVSEVRAGTDTISTASKQIAAGNQDLSSRTEEQASSLEETASSMEELTSTVKQNADNARQANVLANSASDVAVKGGSVVQQVVETMGSINESSKKIVDIIGVIDGIAFQTNILALNAAVEAARAGEQGRGFAVVASEVRNLAQRSASAAKEIKELIGDSVQKVGMGARLVDEAGVTMGEIVDSVRRVTDIISEISSASQEQNTGIEQINLAITQMDQVTQQNAALVEEAAAAAETMQDQAGKLAHVVDVFKLNGNQQGVTAASIKSTTSQPQPAQQPQRHVVRKAPTAARLASSPGTRPRSAAKVVTVTEGEWEQF
ncbi:methyl-accepting chemotaxis protein [Undibacterium sp. Di26W]|uniref:methyl-accepting chemotaxis protein n=1 Tax=Undibacterium sp. Di26W TaxID=3413035 RepID=UPI003BF1BED5